VSRFLVRIETAYARFAVGDVAGYLEHYAEAERHLRLNYELRNERMAEQIEPLLKAGHDVMVVLGRLHWPVGDLLGARGYQVVMSREIRSEEFLPGDELLVLLGQGVDVSAEQADLLRLRDAVAQGLRRALEQQEESVGFYRRVRALTGLWSRDDIERYSREYGALVVAEPEEQVVARVLIRLALASVYAAGTRTPTDVKPLARELADRVDGSTLERLREHLSTAELPESPEELAEWMVRWLRAQGVAVGVILPEPEESTGQKTPGASPPRGADDQHLAEAPQPIAEESAHPSSIRWTLYRLLLMGLVVFILGSPRLVALMLGLDLDDMPVVGGVLAALVPEHTGEAERHCHCAEDALRMADVKKACPLAMVRTRSISDAMSF
jgi:hypothetical protein